MSDPELITRARRDMEICNACRYCEGFCAVFPAMELRRSFTDGDLSYLANLCHNCRGCYYACQYAPPHEFGINVPVTFALLRDQSYRDYAWPRPLARLFHRNGLVVALATAIGIAAALLACMAFTDAAAVFGTHSGPGAFYRVIPWHVMTTLSGTSFLYALMALAIGFSKFWRSAGGGRLPGPRALANAVHDALTLRHLGGGGHGCNDIDEGFSSVRRVLHHALFYGFMLCFASTLSATAYDHLLHLPAPYSWVSLPVVLGTMGGLLMVAGTVGLFSLKLVGDQEPTARNLLGADVALLFLLALIALTGLALLALRATAAMGSLLALHLGLVLTLFLMLPYSKMVHSIYRFGALLRYAAEKEKVTRARSD